MAAKKELIAKLTAENLAKKKTLSTRQESQLKRAQTTTKKPLGFAAFANAAPVTPKQNTVNQTALSFKPKSPDTISAFDVKSNMPQQTQPQQQQPQPQQQQPQPQQQQPQQPTAQDTLVAGAAQGRSALNDLLRFLQQKAEESSIEKFKRLQNEANRPELITSRQETFKTVQRVTSQIKDLRENIIDRSKDVGISTAQASRREAMERQPLTRELEALNDTLSLQNIQIKDVDAQIQNFMDLGRQDQADELKRLTTIASVSGLTDDEKSILSAEIKAKADAQEAITKTLEQNTTDFNTGIADLREFATDNGVITSAFSNVVREATARIQSGETAESVLSDVAAAVMSNPTLQAQFEVERIKQRNLANKAGRSGGGSSSGIKLTNAQKQKLIANGFDADAGKKNFDEISPDAQKFLGFTAGEKGADIKGLNEVIADRVDSFLSQVDTAQIGATEMEAAIAELSAEFPSISTADIRQALIDAGFSPGQSTGFFKNLFS